MEQAEECQLTQLMIAYQAGDLSAFEQLYAILADEARRYYARTHRDRGVIHDLVQDLFLEIHRSRRTYTPLLPVRPWIFGIARNVAARSRRASRLQPNESPEQNFESELARVPATDVPLGESLDNASQRRSLRVHRVPDDGQVPGSSAGARCASDAHTTHLGPRERENGNVTLISFYPNESLVIVALTGLVGDRNLVPVGSVYLSRCTYSWASP
jgi:hypothetical protein